jgi:hypothetical protein
VQATRDEVRALHDGIVGDHTQTRFGFVGDIGRLPTSLGELVARGALPAYTTATTRNIGMGWRGPYVNTGTSATDYLTDAFGRSYSLSSGQLRSAGADGTMSTADDITYPPSPPTVTGNLSVTVKTVVDGKTIVDPSGYRVQLFYASNGSEQSVFNTLPPFTFTNVPMGIHAVQVVKIANPNAGAVMRQDTVVIRPGATAVAELWF